MTREKQQSSEEVACELLSLIAEDSGLRSSYRVRAREHLRRLRRAGRAETAAELGIDAAEDSDPFDADDDSEGRSPLSWER